MIDRRLQARDLLLCFDLVKFCHGVKIVGIEVTPVREPINHSLVNSVTAIRAIGQTREHVNYYHMSRHFSLRRWNKICRTIYTLKKLNDLFLGPEHSKDAVVHCVTNIERNFRCVGHIITYAVWGFSKQGELRQLSRFENMHLSPKIQRKQAFIIHCYTITLAMLDFFCHRKKMIVNCPIVTWVFNRRMLNKLRSQVFLTAF